MLVVFVVGVLGVGSCVDVFLGLERGLGGPSRASAVVFAGENMVSALVIASDDAAAVNVCLGGVGGVGCLGRETSVVSLWPLRSPYVSRRYGERGGVVLNTSGAMIYNGTGYVVSRGAILEQWSRSRVVADVVHLAAYMELVVGVVRGESAYERATRLLYAVDVGGSACVRALERHPNAKRLVRTLRCLHPVLLGVFE